MHNKFHFCLLFLSLLLLKSATAKTDSLYVKEYNRNTSVKIYMYGNFLNFDVIDGAGAKEISYVPNTPLGVGAGFSYKGLIFDMNYGHNIGVKGDENYLKTDAFDFQVHSYKSFFTIDGYYQQYQGLYIDNDTLPFAQANCPDLSIFQTGLVAQYVFNGNCFSYEAAFNQSKQQIKSAGSFLLGCGINYFEIDSDSSFTLHNQNNIQSLQWGINGGYAYNLVFKKHWLLSGSLSIGVNLGNDRFKSFFDKHMYVNPTILPRFAFFYNQPNWSCGFLYVGNINTLLYSDDSQLSLVGGRLEVTYVRRFNYKPGKKRLSLIG
jgi:hypothetical protein